MVEYGALLSLAGYGIGALGGALVFIEFFQTPSYLHYDPEFGSHDIQLTPDVVDEYTWAGRVGALLIALAFALQFLAALL